MKYNFLFVLALITSVACNTKKNEPNSFSIEGKLSNPEPVMIFLNDISSGKPVAVDSVMIGKNGNFKLHGKTIIPAIFILHISKDNFAYLLIEPKETIKLTSDYRNLQKHLKTEGSPGTQLVTELWQKLSVVQSQLDSMKTIYRNNSNSPDIQKIVNDLNDKTQAIIRQHQDYLKKFVKDHSSSLSSIIALYQPIGRDRFLNITECYDYYLMVDSVLMLRYPNSAPVKALHMEVESQRNRLAQNNAPQKSIDPGSEAPEISLPDPDGNVIALSSLRGKYVLVDFWASWCRPCRKENPNLVENFMKYYKKGFDIYQVSLDRNRDDWINAINSDKLVWKHVSDLKYWECAPAKVYHVSSIPANFLLDKDGKIIATNLRGTALSNKLKEIFKF
jgi:peroxiredoxin